MKVITAVLVVLASVLLFAVLFSYPLMWAVNYGINPALIYAVTGLYKLTVWRTLCISFIIGILFKSTSNSGSS